MVALRHSLPKRLAGQARRRALAQWSYAQKAACGFPVTLNEVKGLHQFMYQA